MAPPIDLHYVWALGHAFVLAGSTQVLLATAFFRSTPAFWYRLAFAGALASYTIVILKSLGRPSGGAWLRRAFVDENAQYGLLALYWFISKPINITILPFATFSLFHCATFFRTNILPKFIPKPPAGAPAGQARPPPGWADNLSRQIQLWVKGNYDKAMNFVAYAELLVLARVALGALTFRSSLIAPIFLAHFIRLRYHASPFTRGAVNAITARVDGLVVGKPAPVVNGWVTAKRIIGAWGGGSLVPQQPAAGAAGAVPAAGNGPAGAAGR
ncbi:Transmembrane nucleoporin [Cryptotrichosporon argae]